MKQMKVVLFGILLALPSLMTPANAQSYPSRTVRLIVAFPAGGPIDALTRLIAKHLGDKLGNTFVVENRPGANTILAAQATAASPGDGYTFLMTADPTLSINPHLYSKLPYDPEDFVAVSQIVKFHSHLFVNSQVPVRDLSELIAYARQRPDVLNFGSYGHGSAPRLQAEQLMLATGIKMVHVPFKGSQDSMVAFAANQVQVMLTSAPSARPLVETGKVRPLTASGAQRTVAFPDVPSFAEAGFPQIAFPGWFGLIAPKRTPDAAVKLIADNVIGYVTSAPFINEVLPRYLWEAVGSTPAEFAAYLTKERQAYGELIRDARIARIN